MVAELSEAVLVDVVDAVIWSALRSVTPVIAPNRIIPGSSPSSITLAVSLHLCHQTALGEQYTPGPSLPSVRPSIASWLPMLLFRWCLQFHLHRSSTSSNPPSFLKTIQLSLAIAIRLALHKVVIVILASRTDEKRRAKQRRRGGTKLWDRWDRFWERGGVDEDLLGESGWVLVLCPLCCPGYSSSARSN